MESEIKKQFVAVRAVILKEDKVLIIREADKYSGGVNHGKYDFPGGKVHVGETVTEALVREAKEEVGINISIGRPFFVDEWRPVIQGEQVQIIGIFFLCETTDSEVILSADHDDFRWVSVEEYLSYPLIEATNKAFKVLF